MDQPPFPWTGPRMEVRELGTFAATQTCLMNLDKVMDNIWLKSSI